MDILLGKLKFILLPFSLGMVIALLCLELTNADLGRAADYVATRYAADVGTSRYADSIMSIGANQAGQYNQVAQINNGTVNKQPALKNQAPLKNQAALSNQPAQSNQFRQSKQSPQYNPAPQYNQAPQNTQTAHSNQIQQSNPLALFCQQFQPLQFGSLSEPKTVLFMGTDVVYSCFKRTKRVMRGSCQGNSDTMMLVFLNPVHGTVSVLHIPRDTEAMIGKYGIRKINSANVIGGPQLAKSTVSSLLGVPIDHYVLMNVQGLVDSVNELGGVTVAIPKQMKYMDWTAKLKIDLKPGFHTLTGNQAMGFVRFRHDGLGDIGRVQRQQIFLQAVRNKMIQPASWLHIGNLFQIAQQNLRTDMSPADLFKCANFIHSVPKEKMKFVMLPGRFAGNGDWLSSPEGRVIAQRLASGNDDTASSRHNISVCVINASTNRQLGNQLARVLARLGYSTRLGKLDNNVPSSITKIIAQNGNTANAKMLQQDLGNIGEVVQASLGNILSNITVIAHDDIKLNAVKLPSADAPYTVSSHSSILAPTSTQLAPATRTQSPPPMQFVPPLTPAPFRIISAPVVIPAEARSIDNGPKHQDESSLPPAEAASDSVASPNLNQQ